MKQFLVFNLFILNFFLMLTIKSSYALEKKQTDSFKAVSKSVALNPNSSRSIVLFATGNSICSRRTFKMGYIE